ncbi:MAG: hypothetical protein D3914_15580 [Candidatus Electrothrix sp. LOE2]|jgi:hypothetical protein|nr:hypothetical protein [Candidatus Electrothrix sp. LOE2]
MQQITPYKTLRGALSALDNGGGFFNVFTKANDGLIEPAELSKVAGIFTERQKLHLYLEIALGGLSKADVASALSAMTPDLQTEYRRYRPAHYTPAQANRQGKAADSVIVTGIPHYVQSNADFKGFMFIPICTGNVTACITVPIVDHYDVYEVRDLTAKEDILVAHARGRKKLPKTPVTLGGVLKELKGDGKTKLKHSLFLELLYYSAP